MYEESVENQSDISSEETLSPKKKRGFLFWISTLLLSLTVIFLLLLFWPTGKDADTLKESAQKGVRKVVGKVSGLTIAGDAGYQAVSSLSISSVGARRPIGVNYISVTFKVVNLVDKKQMLDYSIVRIVNKGKYIYPVNQTLTEMYYSVKKKESPWQDVIDAGKSKIVTAIFVAPSKIVDPVLECKDFDWRNSDYKKIPINIKAVKAEKSDKD